MKIHLRLPLTIEECQNGRIELAHYHESHRIVHELSISDEAGKSQTSSDRSIRANKFIQNLLSSRAFQHKFMNIKSISLVELWLDDWEQLLQNHYSLDELIIRKCGLTKRAAYTLGTTLQYMASHIFGGRNNNMNYANEIPWIHHQNYTRNRVVKLSLLQGCSNAWIDGLLRNDCSPAHLELDCESVPAAIRIIKEDQLVIELDDQTPLSQEGLGRILGEASYFKDSTFRCDENQSTIGARVLELANLSLLKKFKFTISLDGGHVDDVEQVWDALCRQLAANRGPACLDIFLHCILNESMASKLASSLIGNDKIEKLYITAKWCCESGLGRVFEAMGQMPRLHSWFLDVASWEKFPPCQQWENEWKQVILRQTKFSKSIISISIPYDLGDKIKAELKKNLRLKQVKELLPFQHVLPSGVWSLVLSQIQSVNPMYGAIREFPHLFQQAWDEEDEAMPSFVVPHHTDCPACRENLEW